VSFSHPQLALAGILLLGVFAWLYSILERSRNAQALLYSNVAFVLEAMRPSRFAGRLLYATWLIGAGALALALSGPHFVTSVPTKNATVVICIDTSGSMRAQDIEPSRGEAAKAAAREFVDDVPAGTRVGLVTFASAAELIQPPTDELDAVREAIERIPAPDGGTAIGDALNVAAQQMPQTGTRVIVLLTDGVSNRGVEPVAASQAIGSKGIAIYTIGIGTRGSGMIIPGTSEEADVDESALRAIAANGNGTYTPAQDASALEGTFRHLALQTVWERKHVDGTAPIALGGGFLVILAFLASLGLGRVP